MNEPCWTPSEGRVEAAAITAFRARCARRAGRPLPDYDALHAWTVEDPDAFWRHLADETLPWRAAPRTVRSMGDDMPATRWFEGGTLNYAEALLEPAGVPDDALAVIADDEAGPRERWSLADLRRETARIQAALRAAGVGRGDPVAAFAANRPETLALLLACAAEGALFTSCSPDFGVEAALARFAQVEPVVLAATPAYRYGGRRFEVRDVAERLAARLPTVRTRVWLPAPGEASPDTPDWVAWPEWRADPASGPRPEYAALPFDQPLYVLFSSGTTGPPKAMVHRAGGSLVTHLKEQRLHLDVRRGDRVLYYTTCGWMMWNWLASALALGAAVVLVEGAPSAPDPLRLWRLASEEGLTFVGVSAGYLHALQARGARPAELDLPALRTVASTGSPLSPAGFAFVHERVAADVHLASISGGTDINGCFLLGVPTLPVYPGQLQRPGLGVDLAVVDEAGRPMAFGPGELVCRQPLPSMPLRFLNDPDGARYRAAYFARFPGVWCHGDRIERTTEGGFRHHGRSDATLNPGGVRIGTAEIYAPLHGLAGVADLAAVGRREGVDEALWLLVVRGADAPARADLAERIRRTLRREASPRHVPRRVLFVDALPRTRSGKLMELAVSALVNGRDPGDTSAAADPGALDAVRAALAEDEGGISP